MIRCRISLIGLVFVVSCISGCNIAGYLGYLIARSGPMRTVEPEFADLDAHSVAVVVYCDQRIQYEHPLAGSEVAYAVVDQLRQHLKHVTVLDPMRVIEYQARNVRWDSYDKTRICKDLDVDYVLFVTLTEFSTRQPGATHLYQGRIAAEASIWDANLPESQARVWYGRDLTATYPDAPVGQLTPEDREIRYRTEKIFAERLVKKFYKHKVPIER